MIAGNSDHDIDPRYRYSRDDEEIYKEFMEIANELIPSIVKSGDMANDPNCFAHILRFYDGLCRWEEGSPTPVLHIVWAKHMVATCSKFLPEARNRFYETSFWPKTIFGPIYIPLNNG
jgi:menin